MCAKNLSLAGGRRLRGVRADVHDDLAGGAATVERRKRLLQAGLGEGQHARQRGLQRAAVRHAREVRERGRAVREAHPEQLAPGGEGAQARGALEAGGQPVGGDAADADVGAAHERSAAVARPVMVEPRAPDGRLVAGGRVARVVAGHAVEDEVKGGAGARGPLAQRGRDARPVAARRPVVHHLVRAAALRDEARVGGAADARDVRAQRLAHLHRHVAHAPARAQHHQPLPGAQPVVVAQRLQRGEPHQRQACRLLEAQAGRLGRHLVHRHRHQLLQAAHEGRRRAVHLVAGREAAPGRRLLHEPRKVEPRRAPLQQAARQRLQEAGQLVAHHKLGVHRVDARAHHPRQNLAGSRRWRALSLPQRHPLGCRSAVHRRPVLHACRRPHNAWNVRSGRRAT
mmetsp:Transcript_26015/g.66946  ORF Transcript_26015/g.66946 Transcript_26015/m.66946 type:complete len:399 (-) Transcript_26015:303-1499(-)